MYTLTNLEYNLPFDKSVFPNFFKHLNLTIKNFAIATCNHHYYLLNIYKTLLNHSMKISVIIMNKISIAITTANLVFIQCIFL